MTEAGELCAGRRLGVYELLVPLAQGATAQVWAARTTGSRLEKIVAVKALLTDLEGDEDVESMFLDEARLCARIRHPNVAAVLDLGEEEDALYIVIEWVEGEPLQVLLREAKGRLPLQLAVRIAKLAASGLHAAHELCDEAGKPVGLVHRDVSPQNILIGYDGSVKVIDFGVAKAASNMQRTSVGQIKGKVPYMAPEQAIGDPVDRRSDIFALGVVLYQLVTGTHPFRGDSEFATLAKLRDPHPVESPSKRVPDLPPALEEAMLTALAKRREDRFPTMLDFGRALEKAVPSPRDIDRALGTFVGALLSERATRREAAIREALRERTGSDARPVNLGNRPIFDEVAAPAPAPDPVPLVVPPTAPAAAAAPAAPTKPGVAFRMPSPRTPAPTDDAGPAPGVATHPAAAAAPTEAVPGSAERDAADIARLRPSRSRTTKIAAAIALLVVVALAIWAVESGPADSEEPHIKRAF